MQPVNQQADSFKTCDNLVNLIHLHTRVRSHNSVLEEIREVLLKHRESLEDILIVFRNILVLLEHKLELPEDKKDFLLDKKNSFHIYNYMFSRRFLTLDEIKIIEEMFGEIPEYNGNNSDEWLSESVKQVETESHDNALKLL